MEGNNLIKKGLAVAIILLFISVSVISSTGTTVEKSILSFDGNTLYVGGNGTGNYTRIQDAINDAWYGDTVFVYDDSSPYYENLQIKRGINLIGEDKNTTVIDGNKQDSVIEILNDDVMVSGFTIWNCKMSLNMLDSAVVRFSGQNNITISDNIISIGGESITHLFTAAIYLKGSTDCSVLDNYIFEEYEKEKTMGIVLDTGSSNNLISGNTISGNYTDGIKTYPACVNNIISENYIHHNKQGIHVYGSDSEIINNKIINNSWEGILLVDGVHNMVSGNIISYNGDGLWDGGIHILGSNRNIISDNEISYNHPTGVYVSVSYYNIISGNNFIDNEGEGYKEEGNAYFNYNRLHFFSTVWKGNYWSDSLSRGRPKIIHGEIQIFLIDRLWINFDWHPALRPYDIPIGAYAYSNKNLFSPNEFIETVSVGQERYLNYLPKDYFQ